MNIDFSIVIPAKNEEASLIKLLPNIKNLYPSTEIIVVDDGSSDNTSDVVTANNCRLVSHPYSLGNGAAIKSGARASTSEYILFMDADSQHNPESIGDLLNKINSGYSMVVGARTKDSQANIFRAIANNFYNFIASKVTGHKIMDLTSGFRIVNRKLFCQYLYLLPNGFSYPTTITMAFFRSGYTVSYVPIVANKRKGKSHINPFVDGMRFLIIILKVGSLYSPLKFFTPVSLILFTIGVCNYFYTYITHGTFTNMSALMILISFIVFMFGLLAEMLTVLTYANNKQND